MKKWLVPTLIFSVVLGCFTTLGILVVASSSKPNSALETANLNITTNPPSEILGISISPTLSSSVIATNKPTDTPIKTVVVTTKAAITNTLIASTPISTPQPTDSQCDKTKLDQLKSLIPQMQTAIDTDNQTLINLSNERIDVENRSCIKSGQTDYTCIQYWDNFYQQQTGKVKADIAQKTSLLNQAKALLNSCGY